MKHFWPVVSMLVVWFGVSSVAQANPLDSFGFGDRGTALAGAMDASADGLSAAAYNPASATSARHVTLGAGYTFAVPDIHINASRTSITQIHAATGALVLPWQIHRNWRAAFAGALFVPLNGLTHIWLRPATEPQAVMWDNRNHRIASQAVVGLDYRSIIALGIGLSAFGGIAGNGMDLDVHTLPGRTQASTNLQIDVPWRIAPIAGIMFRPVSQLRLALRYIDEIALDADIYAESYVHIPGTSIEGDTIVRAEGLDFFSPRSLSMAASIDIDQWTVSAQLAWQQWSRVRQISSDVDLQIQLGIDIDTINFVTPDPNWHDTWIPRLGLEYHMSDVHGRTLDLRWGYAYVPSPVPDQTGLTSFADADRHVIATGIAVGFPVQTWRWSLGIALQAHVLQSRDTIKDSELGVGEDFRLSGAVYNANVFIRTEMP